MERLNLVTGANGHLGSALVRALLARGEVVRASVRDQRDRGPLEGLGCEVVGADLTDPSAAARAVAGVDTVYQVAAVFRHWARDAQREIVDANLAITRNVVEAAARAGVRRVVYVSSAAALDRRQLPIDERTWNLEARNPYFRAKAVSEQLALRLATDMGLHLSSVLPWAILGPTASARLTPSMAGLAALLANRLPFDPGFNMNVVHVDDVVDGVLAAAERGRAGERYLLGNESHLPFRRIAEIAHELFPEVRVPPTISLGRLKAIAAVMELRAWLTGAAPPFRLSLVSDSYHADLRSDVSKARRELGFRPRSPEEAVRQTLVHLWDGMHRRGAT